MLTGILNGLDVIISICTFPYLLLAYFLLLDPDVDF